MRFAGVASSRLSEGEISDLHIGLKGTMNAIFLKDLADKTRRGLRGRVEQGKSGGGNSYGYDVVKRIGETGEPSAANAHQRDEAPSSAASSTTTRRAYRRARSRAR